MFRSVYAPISEGRRFSEVRTKSERRGVMTFILWLIAVILVVLGIGAILRREVIWGAVLIIVGLLVGPGGVSVFA